MKVVFMTIIHNRKYRLLFVLLLLTTAFIASSCVSQPAQTSNINSETSESSSDIITGETQTDDKTPKHVLRVASVHFPPFEVIQDGEFSGPGYDILHEAFNRMGYKPEEYELVVFPWARTLEMMKDGDVDIILDISRNEERMEYIDYSEESFTEYDKNFITLEGFDGAYDGTIDSLSDYTIGVVREYRIGPNYQDARASGNYTFEDASSFDENIEKLLLGRVPIILDTTYSVQLHIKELGNNTNLNILEPAYDSTTTYVGFSKKLNDTSIRNAYDKAVRSMKEDGTFQAILDKYFK